MKIHIKDKHFVRYAKEKLFLTKHMENMLLILIHLDEKENNGKHFSYLTNSSVMRAFLLDNEGGKAKEKVAYLQQVYKDHELVKQLKTTVKSLKIHNLVETIKEIKKNYKSFWTKVKNGDSKAKRPRPKKLRELTHFTLHTDSAKAFTLKKKNKIGLNLDTHMVYTHVRHDALEKVTGSLENVQNIRVHYSNGLVYLEVVYKKPPSNPVKEELKQKYASLDIGVNILGALWIEDEETPSLLLDGKPLKSYNANYNRFRAKLSASIDTCQNEVRKQRLFLYRRYLTEKRNQYFHSIFHQYAKRILEYCQLHGVTHLVLSDNLAKLKYNGENKLRKKTKQSFMSIPFLQLLKQLQDKAPKYGIIISFVNEAYTSKTSSLSADIKEIQEKAQKGVSLSTNDFKGSRVKRGNFKDRPTGYYVHADINGARNIGFLGGAKNGKTVFSKYRNPLKFSSDYTLCRMIMGGSGIRESVGS